MKFLKSFELRGLDTWPEVIVVLLALTGALALIRLFFYMLYIIGKGFGLI